eukprot:gnl/TRDRNA2_/TRDRNA2_164124_c0_seq4.p1 gnl/TRDRNA2_/TRDRNA2_164124_c0~~gnl/TRDRNA2_/TRDRNA2_164124_c0_seq4.p1  ORF type:complete len:471 (+),score=136.99 gnl/TRDRNA2_/TRDRNA2_164124_c0_seq4:71-1483(+)
MGSQELVEKDALISRLRAERDAAEADRKQLAMQVRRLQEQDDEARATVKSEIITVKADEGAVEDMREKLKQSNAERARLQKAVNVASAHQAHSLKASKRIAELEALIAKKQEMADDPADLRHEVQQLESLLRGHKEKTKALENHAHDVKIADARVKKATERAEEAEKEAASFRKSVMETEASIAEDEKQAQLAEAEVNSCKARASEVEREIEKVKKQFNTAEAEVRRLEARAEEAEAAARRSEETARGARHTVTDADARVRAAECRAIAAEAHAREVAARAQEATEARNASEARYATEADEIMQRTERRTRDIEVRAFTAEARARDAEERMQALEAELDRQRGVVRVHTTMPVTTVTSIPATLPVSVPVTMPTVPVAMPFVSIASAPTIGVTADTTPRPPFRHVSPLARPPVDVAGTAVAPPHIGMPAWSTSPMMIGSREITPVRSRGAAYGSAPPVGMLSPVSFQQPVV